jgi:ribosomal protein L44E
MLRVRCDICGLTLVRPASGETALARARVLALATSNGWRHAADINRTYCMQCQEHHPKRIVADMKDQNAALEEKS